MSDKLYDILTAARNLAALLEQQRATIMGDGPSDLEPRWAAVMTEAWQAIPERVRLASMTRHDPLAPADTERRLPEAVKLLASMSMTGESFVREKSTGDIYLDLGSAYFESELLHLRLLRLYARNCCEPVTGPDYQPVRALVLSEFRATFVPAF